jgi:hypothetical protein
MIRRLEIRPVASRRLRAALLLVLLLSVLSLSQSSLSGWSLAVVVSSLMAVFVQAWRAASRSSPMMALTFKPIKALLIDLNGVETSIHCTRLSVYPWLIVLHAEIPQQGRQVIIWLPDSLPDCSSDQWRHLLVWAKRMRRQVAMQ